MNSAQTSWWLMDCALGQSHAAGASRRCGHSEGAAEFSQDACGVRGQRGGEGRSAVEGGAHEGDVVRGVGGLCEESAEEELVLCLIRVLGLLSHRGEHHDGLRGLPGFDELLNT